MEFLYTTCPPLSVHPPYTMGCGTPMGNVRLKQKGLEILQRFKGKKVVRVGAEPTSR